MTTGDKLGRSTSFTSCRWQVSVFATILLVGFSSGLPVGKEQKPSRPDVSLLNGAVGELEDALSRLRQYAQGLKSDAGRGRHGEAFDDDHDDPLAESVERESRDEDYRQEPELVPDLDRFGKNVDESKEARAKNQHSAARDEASEISLQDLVNFLRERKSKKTDGQTGEGDVNRLIELKETKTTAKSTVAANGSPQSKDVSIDELVEFLKEKQKEKGRSDDRLPTKSPELQSAVDVGRKSANAESNGMSLNEALEYLASLKKKLNKSE